MAKNQSTGQAAIYHFNISTPESIQHGTEVSKSRQISRNQCTGHARIYHYHINQAKTIQHCTDTHKNKMQPSHNYEKLATTVLELARII